MRAAGVQGNTTAEGKLESYSSTGWEEAYNATYQDKYEDTYSEAYSTAAEQQSSLNTTSNATESAYNTVAILADPFDGLALAAAASACLERRAVRRILRTK